MRWTPDGVIADFTHSFGEMGNRLFPGWYVDGWQPTTYDWSDMYSAYEMGKVWEAVKATPNFWLGLRAYSDNVGALARWLMTRCNQDVYVVTSRVDTAGMTVADQTHRWLQACGVSAVHNYLGVIVVPESDRKWELYEAMGIGWSLDDKAETVEQCDRLGEGHRAYLLDRPWNVEAVVKRRVGSVEKYLEEVDRGTQGRSS